MGILTGGEESGVLALEGRRGWDLGGMQAGELDREGNCVLPLGA